MGHILKVLKQIQNEYDVNYESQFLIHIEMI